MVDGAVAGAAAGAYEVRLWRYLRGALAARRRGRGGSGSQTAQAAALMRAVAHLEGRGADRLAWGLLWEELAVLVPTPSAARALRLAYDAKFPGLYGHVAARTAVIDKAVLEALEGGASQVVVLGAGLDTRAYRLSAPAGTAWVEVDTPASQEDKRRGLEAAGVGEEERAHVAFLPVDFETDSLAEALAGCAAYDPSRPAVFVWEFVAPYLTAGAVEEALWTVWTSSAPGSALIFDFVDSSIYATSQGTPIHGAREFIDGVRMVGEGSLWGLAPHEHVDWARERGFEIMECHGPGALDRGPALEGTGVRSYGFYHVLVSRRAANRPLGTERPALAAGVAADEVTPTKAASEEDLVAQVLSVLQATLGEDGEEVDEDSSFMDIGMESIEVTKLARGVEKLTGRGLGEAAIFEHDSARALAGYLAGLTA